MVQCIHVTFEIGKLVSLGDAYKNQLITQAMRLYNTGIHTVWLTIRLNYGNTVDYRHITIVDLIQHINDCIYHHLKKSISETSYGIIPVEVLELEPLKFSRGIMQSPTSMDRFVNSELNQP